MTAGLQFAGGQFGISNVEQQQRLNRIDFRFAVALEVILDDIEKAAMQALDEVERLEIFRLDRMPSGLNSLSKFILIISVVWLNER